MLFFSDKGQVYKARVNDFAPSKASALGDYVPTKLAFDEGERVAGMAVLADGYNTGDMIAFIFANGKGVRIPISAYETKANRRRLTGAYSTVSPLVGVFHIKSGEDPEILLVTNDKRAMLIKSSLICEKNTRSASGTTLATLKNGRCLSDACIDYKSEYPKGDTVRKIKLPATPSAM